MVPEFPSQQEAKQQVVLCEKDMAWRVWEFMHLSPYMQWSEFGFPIIQTSPIFNLSDIIKVQPMGLPRAELFYMDYVRIIEPPATLGAVAPL